AINVRPGSTTSRRELVHPMVQLIRRALPASSAAVEEVYGFGGPVGEDGVGTGPADGGQRLQDRAVAVDPAVRRGSFHHRVLAGDVVRRDRDVHVVTDLADDFQV